MMEDMKRWANANCHPEHVKKVLQDTVAKNQMRTAIYGGLLAVTIIWVLVKIWTRSSKPSISRPSTPDIEKPKGSLLAGKGVKLDRKWGGIYQCDELFRDSMLMPLGRMETFELQASCCPSIS